MKNLAPIVLFVYNRPWHTQQTIEALQKNGLANESELFIYSDAPKNESIMDAVAKVREYIKTITGFKTVKIIQRETNWGLAANIIDGVTDIVNRYGKIIVLEDDLVTSPYFLQYMNNALEFYEDEKKLWHITGWNPPIPADHLDDTFAWRGMNCWGWATWADRWHYYEKNTDRLILEFNTDDIQAFNLDSAEDFWSHLLANRDGIINTWAIYWYAAIFQNHGLCLSPTMSFVTNIGHDGSGIHCGESGFCDNSVLNHKKTIHFTTDIHESALAFERIRTYYLSQKKPLPIRAINKLSRILLGKNVIR
jgi:hypothetical protein